MLITPSSLCSFVSCAVFVIQLNEERRSLFDSVWICFVSFWFLWVFCVHHSQTNPLKSFPDSSEARVRLQSAGLVQIFEVACELKTNPHCVLQSFMSPKRLQLRSLLITFLFSIYYVKPRHSTFTLFSGTCRHVYSTRG